MNKLQRFIHESSLIHNNKYDYSKVTEIELSGRVTIICPEHGEFRQRARNHKKGARCKKCFRQQQKQNLKLPLNKFIEKATLVHGDKYDYSKSEYVNSYTKITIICPEHGEFEQTPKSHIYGKYGCKLCGIKNLSNTIDDFINKSSKLHNNKYDYSDSIYKSYRSHIIIKCPKHGKFKQLTRRHLEGHGCPKCAINTPTTEDIINRAISIHGDKYSYDKSNYSGYMEPITITCIIHGNFSQTVSNHLNGHGCPKCSNSISKPHQEIIEYIKSINTEYIINDRKTIYPLEIDIYLPNHNVAIEYNGLYYHSYNHTESKDERFKHQAKHTRCVENNIQLLQINEDEWSNKQNIVKSIINHKLGYSSKLYARKCKIISLNTKDYDSFMTENHIYGSRDASVRIGLTYNGELVACMSFAKHHKYKWEIIRYAQAIGSTAIGGAGKLLNHFIALHDPKSILTYADARYSTGNLYKKLGFKPCGLTKPNYKYYKDGNTSILYSRQHFQKHKLSKLLENFDSRLTEAENMFNNKYRRLWDAGHYKFILKP